MTSNMDYGLFGIQMEINNLRDTIKKIRKILCILMNKKRIILFLQLIMMMISVCITLVIRTNA